jgi:hypothetical protein
MFVKLTAVSDSRQRTVNTDQIVWMEPQANETRVVTTAGVLVVKEGMDLIAGYVNIKEGKNGKR